jgi:hypothetical protein
MDKNNKWSALQNRLYQTQYNVETFGECHFCDYGRPCREGKECPYVPA